jgi:CubicO group peptidase (beta-lactamase class C family)
VGTAEGSPYAAAGGWARLAGTAGAAGAAGGPVPADAGTRFDLASLTKVVVTLPLVLLLHQRGRWSIDDPVARWLPGAPRSPVTISDCLLHAAGLVPHRPYYATCGGHRRAGRCRSRPGQLQRSGFHAARLGRGGMRRPAAGRTG